MTKPDYRAMCTELVEALHEHTCLYEGHESELVARARALLAQPEPEGPSDWDLKVIMDSVGGPQFDSGPRWMLPFARAVLARYGRPTPQPVADGEVAELCAWLRNNSSGIYRPAARAADLLERLASDNAGLEAAADSLWADNVSLLDNCHD